MTDHSAQDDAVDRAADSAVGPAVEPNGDAEIGCTAAYEQDDVVVFYDSENPLAWIEADSAVAVDQMA